MDEVAIGLLLQRYCDSLGRMNFTRALPLAALLACSSSDAGVGQGNVQVFIVPEDTITAGLEPGTDVENIVDGWKVEYTKFLVTIGNFRAKSSASGKAVGDPTIYVLDLKNAPAGGYVTFEAKAVEALTFDKVGQDMPAATASAKALPPTTAADLALMQGKGYALYFEGTMTKADGQSCKPGSKDPKDCVAAPKISFKWGFSMGTAFDDCGKDGKAGFAVPVGGTVGVKPTIHGDHWFFSDLTEGVEVTKRRAQYVADADLNHDGETTLDELRAVKAADAFPTDLYKLSGAIGGKPIATAYDFVESQARTLHDYQGDGECPTRTVLK